MPDPGERAAARDGDFELVTLQNGARAVRHVVHGEVMHPSVGPWQEARALYVTQSNLRERLRAPGAPLHVWDVGLGAGTNAVAALDCARSLGLEQRRELRITSFEQDLAPLRLACADREGFSFLQPYAAAIEQLIAVHRYAEPRTHWDLHLGDALERWRTRSWEPPDLIYFDPFSPASNPAFWTPSAFAMLRRHTRNDRAGSTLFTYSAATPTRVSLLLGGFFVGVGAATGMKTETTVAATRRELLGQPLDQRWLGRWERSSAQAPHGQELDDGVRAAVRGHPQFA